MKDFNTKLEELKKGNNNPFLVPEDYFNQFPSKMQEKVIENKQEYWIIRAFNLAKPQLTLGFMIIAFAVIAITSTNYILSIRTESSLKNSLYTRIMDIDASEFSEQHFMDVLLEDEIQPMEQDKIETDYYMNYLLDQDIDYSTLMNEF